MVNGSLNNGEGSTAASSSEDDIRGDLKRLNEEEEMVLGGKESHDASVGTEGPRSDVTKGNGDKKLFSVERRRLSDAIFLTIEDTRRELINLSSQEEGAWLNRGIDVPVRLDPETNTTDVTVPMIPVLSLAVGTRVALKWHQRSSAEGDEELVRKEKEKLLQEATPARSVHDLINLAPDVEPILDVLVDDIIHGGGKIDFLRHGIDRHFIQDVSSDFFVKARPGLIEQTHEIIEGLFHRLQTLFSPESMQRLEEMRGWQVWRPRVEAARVEHISMLQDIYGAVEIRPKLIRNLVSSSARKRAEAIDAVERDAGFLHKADKDELLIMLEKGITAVVPDLAYFSVIADPVIVKQMLTEYCGFDPTKEYTTIKHLPMHARKKSKDGKKWPIDWVNKRSALEMLQDPDSVAFTAEMAVKKMAVAEGGTAPYRRDSGIASALKYEVYSKVPQPLIFTRYFEIIEVNGVSVPSAVNRGSAYSIQALGGHHLGIAEETFDVNPGELDPVTVKVLWHYCLADRDVALRRLEQRVSGR